MSAAPCVLLSQWLFSPSRCVCVCACTRVICCVWEILPADSQSVRSLPNALRLKALTRNVLLPAQMGLCITGTMVEARTCPLKAFCFVTVETKKFTSEGQFSQFASDESCRLVGPRRAFVERCILFFAEKKKNFEGIDFMDSHPVSSISCVSRMEKFPPFLLFVLAVSFKELSTAPNCLH